MPSVTAAPFSSSSPTALGEFQFIIFLLVPFVPLRPPVSPLSPAPFQTCQVDPMPTLPSVLCRGPAERFCTVPWFGAGGLFVILEGSATSPTPGFEF